MPLDPSLPTGPFASARNGRFASSRDARRFGVSASRRNRRLPFEVFLTRSRHPPSSQVHTANQVARRHVRSWLCDTCQNGSAKVRRRPRRARARLSERRTDKISGFNNAWLARPKKKARPYPFVFDAHPPARRHIPFEYLLAITNHTRSQFSTLARRFSADRTAWFFASRATELTRSVNGRLEGKSVPPRAPLRAQPAGQTVDRRDI